jgi:DNA-binding transcriptional ArsR family regulator
MSKHSDALSATFAALADPTRRAMLVRLSQGEINVSALAEPFQMSLPAATKHLRVLERAGLVQKSRNAQRRPCRLNAEPLKQATDWISQYRQFWEESLDRLDAYLQQIQAVEKAQKSAVLALPTLPATDPTSVPDSPDSPSIKRARSSRKPKTQHTQSNNPRTSS